MLLHKGRGPHSNVKVSFVAPPRPGLRKASPYGRAQEAIGLERVLELGSTRGLCSDSFEFGQIDRVA